MTLRIDAANLAGELEEALACVDNGGEVLIERDGKVVAALTPRREEKRTLEALIAALSNHPDVDEDFERDLETAREWLNRPVEEPRWVP